MRKRFEKKREARYAILEPLLARGQALQTVLKGENACVEGNVSDLQLVGSVIEWKSCPEVLDPSAGDLKPDRALRKRQQVESMVAHVAHFLHDDDVVVDFGSGSGHLGLTIAYFFPKVSVILVERKEWTTTVANERIADLGLTNVSTRCCDIYDFDAAKEKMTLAVSLHSCGWLTDFIIETCVRNECSYCLVPCCYGQRGGKPEVSGQSTGALNAIVSHPKSRLLASQFTADEFDHIASGADFAVAATNNWNEFTNNDNFIVAKQCMRLIDLDRASWTSDQVLGKYRLYQSSLQPLNCSPKNNVLIAMARDRS